MRKLVWGICAAAMCGAITHVALAVPQKRAGTSGLPAYERAVVEARKAGMAVLPTDVKTGPVPLEQNAALIYRQIDAHLKKQPTGTTDDDVLKLLRRTPALEDEVAKGRELLKERAEFVRLIHEAASRPKCDFQRDWSKGPALLLPEYARMRAAARWLVGESGLALHDGKPLDAINNLTLGFRISRYAAADPTLIGHLVSIAVDAITLRGMESILYAAGTQPGVAQAVRTAIDREWKKPSMAYSMRTEPVMQYVVIQMLHKGGIKTLKEIAGLTSGNGTPDDVTPTGPMTSSQRKAFDKLLEENGAVMLADMRHIIAAADRPYPEANSVMAAISDKVEASRDRKYMLAKILFPVFGQAAAARARDEALASVIRCAAEVLAYKVKNGRFPDTLAEAISPVPTDPFDLKPLRYRREGGGFVVWSVGATQQFDGGDPNTKPTANESVFHYPLPAYLRDTKPAK